MAEETLIQKIRSLPPERVAEADVVWDNSDDAEYDGSLFDCLLNRVPDVPADPGEDLLPDPLRAQTSDGDRR